MLAGELRERVSLQSKTVTRDELNGDVVSWANQATVWAAVEVVTGRFAHVADQIQEPTTIRVRIRKGLPVTNLWRILWLDRILNIQAVLPLSTQDGWDLLCSEGMNDG